MNDKKPIELLAPAGTPEAAVAAADAGADAIYCGLGKFNARERAQNFTFDTLGRTVELYHSRGKKVYLTLNTLIKENELGAAAELAAQALSLEVDGVIVQDIGVMWLLKNYFPQLPIHASTQVGIHNSAGVAAMTEIGVKRVILERQITLAELREIAKSTSTELEVFVHGSLCCSLSGRCLLSSYCGGGSGNRGKCRQPCRHYYSADRGKSGFFLSPSDLIGTTLLDDLRQIGVASLKIEGRMRSCEYVWKTVHAYRLLLDDPVTNADEARQLLQSSSTRHGSTGFYFAENYRKLISPTQPGYFGSLVGVVDKARDNGVKLLLRRRLHLGDKLRLVAPESGESSDGFVVTSMLSTRGEVKIAGDGDSIFIAGNFAAKPGYHAVKISENGWDFTRQTAALPPKRFPIRLNLRLSATQCEATSPDFPKWRWCETTDFAPPRANFCDVDAVTRIFAAGAPEPWRVALGEVVVDGEFFAPVGVLKSLRRLMWQALLPIIPSVWEQSAGAAALMRFYRDYQAMTSAGAPTAPSGKYLTLPTFVPQSELDSGKKRLQSALKSGKFSAIVVSWQGWAWSRTLPSIHLIAGTGIPVTNSLAARLLRELGFSAFQWEVELEPTAREATALKSPLTAVPNPEINSPLLVTRIPLTEGNLTDFKGRKFIVRHDPFENLWKIYPAPDSATTPTVFQNSIL